MRKPTTNCWPQRAGQGLIAAGLALAAGAALQAADVTVTGVLKNQFYNNGTLSSVEGGTATLTYVESVSSFNTAVNKADNYAERVSGWFTPTQSGKYVFFVASDDDSDLFVSTDASPANKKLVAHQNTWGNQYEWTTAEGGGKAGGVADVDQKNSSLFTPDAGVTVPFAGGIQLNSGTSYYIEGVHHEGGGGDDFAATFKLLADADPANGTTSALTGSLISAKFTNPTTLTISTQPADTKVAETAIASFTVGVSQDGELSPTYQWRKNGTAIANATSATYAFQALNADNGATFDCVVKTPAVGALTVLSATSTGAKLTVDAAVSISGVVKHEYFAGASRASVEGNTAGAPTYTELLSKFETGVNFADNYANRISGYFTPDTTGLYVFFVASDDDSDLFLSTDDQPGNKRLIAQQNSWGNNLEWLTAEGGAKTAGVADVDQKNSSTFTPDGGVTVPFANGISLTKNTKYYFEGVHHEGGGGDNFSATFTLIADAPPDNGTATALTGSLVSTKVPKGDITVTLAPVAVSTIEGRIATFTVKATATGVVAPTYQWQKNGVDIAGATAGTYSTPVLALGDDGAYRVKVFAPGSETDTAPVALTVGVDNVPPQIVSVGGLNKDGSVQVGVVFDEKLNLASVVAGNFTLSSGSVSGVTYIDNSSGLLSLEHGAVISTTGLSAGGTYTLTVKDVADVKGNKMASTAVQFTVQKLKVAFLGNDNPDLPDSAIGVGADGVNLQNGGNAFWGTEDDVTFAYEEITGDFDKSIQIEYHDAASNWSRAGLMVRESLDALGDTTSATPASRYQAVHADPAPIKFDGTPSNNAWETNRRTTMGGATDSSSAGGAPVYPNVWVRLRRVGSVIHMYRGNDGVTWTELGRTDFEAAGDQVPLPAKMLVGIVLGAENGNVSPDDQDKVWTARYRHYGNYQPNKVAGKQAYSIGVHFGDDETTGSLGWTEIAGVDAVAQAHWLSEPSAKSDVLGPQALVADVHGVTQNTTATVEWDSPNTWSSTGRGEENNGFAGSDRILMTGYLDTGNATTTTITVHGLPTALTTGKYDLVVYALGGVAARGGGYRVTDLNGVVLSDYQVMVSPANPSTFVQVANPAPLTPSEGNYLVFKNLSAKDVIIEGTTENGLGQSGTPRAPIDAIQFVSPTGLLTAVVVTPTISISGNTITFVGKLQSSDTLTGFTDVAGATSPFTISATGAQKLYRSSQ